MLFGKHNRQALEHLLSVTLERGIKHSVTVNYNEPKFIIVLEEFLKRLCVESVLALVAKLGKRQKWLDVDNHLLLGLAVVKQDYTTEQNQSVVWGPLVQLNL
jgi:hypothetical protein